MSEAVAYYNEIDPFAANWLRNLIAAGRLLDDREHTEFPETAKLTRFLT